MKLIEEIFGRNRNTFREDSGDMKFAGFEVANYISDVEKSEALEWRDEPESLLFKAAKKGDKSAINYLFLKSGQAIYKAFKTYTGPDTYYFNQAVRSGEYEDFIAEAYALLKNGYLNRMGEVTLKSPLNTFKSEIFDEGDKVNKFKYYYLQYLKNMASSIKNEKDSHGVSTWDTDEVGKIKGKNEKNIKINSTSLDNELTGNHSRGDADNGKYSDYLLDSQAQSNGSQYNLENEYINDEELYSFIKSWKKITSDEKFDEDVKKCVKGLIEYPDLKAEDCAKKVYGTPEELGIKDWEFHNQYGLRFTNTLRKKLPKILDKYGFSISDFIKAYTKRPDILIKYL